MSDLTRTCQLCYAEFEIFDTTDGVILKCECPRPLVKATTLEKAYEQLETFEVELEQGANMWGSKIDAGVAED